MFIYQIAVISLKTTNVQLAKQEKSGSQPNQAVSQIRRNNDLGTMQLLLGYSSS